ncbi:CRISPR-associated protein Cas1 [Desulfofarcimen acetoxidans DSM 771]|jgi:CRISPR-associated protein Cas1|uniref:CRISPR-associated endonuclease Cas1 n=1 Tax=Desulfofarcimen acetoxidans (strain ATCC 49208 / DSM 771 / KCTC 5769 / VKM B-1644 / 5575) TaxID=485916 RepID=C8W346_DESAS|nr:type I-B CRISPR-associated endonuclease Cas1b [Desulfofarcimen acetoxidans]ACV61813.1 CRISPR-associated protein Cas1 [Desulfofarcimen acetoxidans DSM 771]
MAESFYLFSNGELQRKDNVLRITASDGRYKDIKVEMTQDIYLFGEVDLNTKCLNYAGQLSIPIHIFNYYGSYTGSFYPKEKNVSGKLLIEQVNHYTDKYKRLEIAKAFIEAASYNILRNLRYYSERGRDLQACMTEIKGLRKVIPRTEDINELMGIEGCIRQAYYNSWKDIINQEVDFEKRVKRPPDNMINALISFVNSLIYATCLTEIYKTQLHPTVSYLHSAGERRFSLCLDISEIFKPLIGDRLIFSMLNKNMLTEKDFESQSNFCYLKDNGRKRLLQKYDEDLKRTIRHKVLNKNVSYRYLIRLECYKLIKHLMSDKKYEGFTIWW